MTFHFPTTPRGPVANQAAAIHDYSDKERNSRTRGMGLMSPMLDALACRGKVLSAAVVRNSAEGSALFLFLQLVHPVPRFLEPALADEFVPDGLGKLVRRRDGDD